ncbi:hypothetical protein ACMFMG_009558 [Clarireedia jacksonii]
MNACRAHSTTSNLVFPLHLSRNPNQAITIVTIKEKTNASWKENLVVKNKDQPPQKLLFPFDLKSPNPPPHLHCAKHVEIVPFECLRVFVCGGDLSKITATSPP